MENDSEEDKGEDGDAIINCAESWVEFGMHINGVDMVKEVNIEEFADEELKEEAWKAYDDVTGQEISAEGVRKARKE